MLQTVESPHQPLNACTFFMKVSTRPGSTSFHVFPSCLNVVPTTAPSAIDSCSSTFSRFTPVLVPRYTMVFSRSTRGVVKPSSSTWAILPITKRRLPQCSKIGRLQRDPRVRHLVCGRKNPDSGFPSGGTSSTRVHNPDCFLQDEKRHFRKEVPFIFSVRTTSYTMSGRHRACPAVPEPRTGDSPLVRRSLQRYAGS